MKRQSAPGAWCEPRIVRRSFSKAWNNRAADLVIADAKVLRLHPQVKKTLKHARIISLPAREVTKSLHRLEWLAMQTRDLPRHARILALGGGTIGDLATVFTHLHKRGATLIHVPTTLVALVDSSLGGKGALNVGTAKNALGVFHYPAEVWQCSEFLSTLSQAQRREGFIEAFKTRLVGSGVHPTGVLPALETRIKLQLCRRDPYDTDGLRVALNLGHTFGHAIESLSRFRIRHGIAVGMGLIAAADVGLALGVTPVAIHARIHSTLPREAQQFREFMAHTSMAHLRDALSAEKKGASRNGVTMVLLTGQGRWRVQVVSWALLSRLRTRWAREAGSP